MNYENAYKQALERMKNYCEGHHTDVNPKAVMEYVFPELRESEDERIRKTLLKLFNDMEWDDSILHDYELNKEKTIAWLEKQGEYHRLVNFDEAEKEKDDFTTRKFLCCNTSFDGFNKNEHYWLEYIGDDKYVGRSDNILGMKFHITPRQLFSLFNEIPNESNEPNEPQPEKTEKTIKSSLTTIENPFDNQIIDALIHELKEQDGILTAICGIRTKTIISWLEKQKKSDALINTTSEMEYAKNYSYDVWEKLMSKFNAIAGYRIGCNDVSDIVLNAILNAFEWQNKQKPIEQDTETRDLWVYIREWNNKFGRLPKDEDELASCIDYVMKRQKPADNYCQENCKGYRDTGGKCFADGECEAKKKAEQSSFWTEDDEEKFRDVIRLVEQGSPVQPIRDHYTNWLKSIKDRFQLQPKQE